MLLHDVYAYISVKYQETEQQTSLTTLLHLGLSPDLSKFHQNFAFQTVQTQMPTRKAQKLSVRKRTEFSIQKL
jgi:hypothetical protein